jgi:hypothetical protein
MLLIFFICNDFLIPVYFCDGTSDLNMLILSIGRILILSLCDEVLAMLLVHCGTKECSSSIFVCMRCMCIKEEGEPWRSGKAVAL